MKRKKQACSLVRSYPLVLFFLKLVSGIERMGIEAIYYMRDEVVHVLMVRTNMSKECID